MKATAATKKRSKRQRLRSHERRDSGGGDATSRLLLDT